MKFSSAYSLWLENKAAAERCHSLNSTAWARATWFLPDYAISRFRNRRCLIFMYLQWMLADDRNSVTLHQFAEKRKVFPTFPTFAGTELLSCEEHFSSKLLLTGAVRCHWIYTKGNPPCGNQFSFSPERAMFSCSSGVKRGSPKSIRGGD
ncbi:MAG: hypothetical protein DMG92_10980 [Acidobacteria bacterium]|nr:MAG: hypothetical protein DMG92_10980 [Acidobacteriota bacterium]